MRIVFVCTTNVLGSAIADLMARSLLAEWDPDRELIQIESAGVRAKVGATIPAVGQRVLAEFGVQAGEHRARWMSPDVLMGADLVITMGAIQREAALALNPRGLRKTFTLLEATRLIDKISVSAPLANDLTSHARAVISEMAKARRFRPSIVGSDDLVDLAGAELNDLRCLIGEVHAQVYTLIRTLAMPDLAVKPLMTHSAPLRDASGSGTHASAAAVI